MHPLLSDPQFAALGTVVGTSITGLAAVVVAKISRRSTDRSSDGNSTLKILERRLDRVERHVIDLRAELDRAQRVIQAATGYVDRLLWWVRTGRRGKMPGPPEILVEHIDPNLLDPADDGDERPQE